MYRKIALASAVLMALAAILASVSPAAAKMGIFYNFEQGLKPFAFGLDSPSNAGSLELHLDHLYIPGLDALTGEADIPINHYARIKFIPADSPSGSPAGSPSAAWMMARYEGTGKEVVRISFEGKRMDGCGACMPIVYAGAEKPSRAGQFALPAPKPTDLDSDLGCPPQTWQTYKYTSVIDSDGAIYIGIGWNAPSEMNEETVVAGIDNVNIEIFAAP